MTDPIVERLTSYAAGLEYEDLPSEVVRSRGFGPRMLSFHITCGIDFP